MFTCYSQKTDLFKSTDCWFNFSHKKKEATLTSFYFFIDVFIVYFANIAGPCSANMRSASATVIRTPLKYAVMNAS